MKSGLSFAEDAIFGNEYSVTDFVIVVNPAGIFLGGVTICQ